MITELHMSIADIAREYRNAKNKKEQIKILADENLCTKDDIVRVLLETGIPESELPKKPGPKPGQMKAKKPRTTGEPSGRSAEPLLEETDPEERTIIQKALKCYAGTLRSRAEKILEEIDHVNKLLEKKEKENGNQN